MFQYVALQTQSYVWSNCPFKGAIDCGSLNGTVSIIKHLANLFIERQALDILTNLDIIFHFVQYKTLYHKIKDHRHYLTLQPLPTQSHKATNMEHNPDTMDKKIDDKSLSSACTYKQCNDKEMKTSKQEPMESFPNGFLTLEENDGKGNCMSLVLMKESHDMKDKKFDDAKLSNALHQLVDFDLRCYFTDDDVTDLLIKYDANVDVVKQQMRDIISDMIGWSRTEREHNRRTSSGLVDKHKGHTYEKDMTPSIVSSRGLKNS